MAKDVHSLSNLFAELNRFGQNQDYEKAVKYATKILQASPGDEVAFHYKVVCLIHLNRFDEALTLIHKKPKLASNLLFEKAYCEYRLNRTTESLKTLQSVEEPDERIKELLGQVLYRLEQYAECFQIYRNLLKNSQDSFEEERETNLSAVLAALQTWGDEDTEDPGLRTDTYELCYNSACFQLGKGNYEGAVEKLRTAEDICRKMFEDDPDSTEEDIDAELEVIRVQMAYALQMSGNTEEATKLYNQVTKQKPSDIGVAAVAANNIITLNKDQNVFDSKKKIKTATADGLQQKLNTDQRKTISMNQCLLYMYTNQGDRCRTAACNLQKTYPENDTPSLIEAAQCCKEKQVSQAIKILQAQIDKNPESSLALKLTVAQLHIQQGHIYAACDVMKSIEDHWHKPGMVSALVTLYLNQEDLDSATEILHEAVEWYKANEPNSEALPTLMRANSRFLLSHGKPREATVMLEELKKRNPGDLKIMAQLISAYSKFDPGKAQEVSRQLPVPENVGQDIDVDFLESSVSLGPKYVKKAAKTEMSPKVQSPRGDTVEVVKKKKKKKVKLPKNLDPDATPDPERWLPLRERSYYRGRRKKTKKDVGKGTQGAASVMSELDASKSGHSASADKGVGSPKSGGSSTPATPTPTGPRHQKPASGKQRKKRKGNKW